MQLGLHLHGGLLYLLIFNVINIIITLLQSCQCSIQVVYLLITLKFSNSLSRFRTMSTWRYKTIQLSRLLIFSILAISLCYTVNGLNSKTYNREKNSIFSVIRQKHCIVLFMDMKKLLMPDGANIASSLHEEIIRSSI